MNIKNLKLPKYNQKALILKACQQHNQWQEQKAAQLHDLYAEIQTMTPQAHPAQLARICVNYLRHVLEIRHSELSGLRGDSSQFERYAQVKNAMLDCIALTYPWLAEECERQRV